MPLTKKGKKIMKAMKKQYGSKKGKSVFYASKHKGTIKDVDGKNSRKVNLEKYRKSSSDKVIQKGSY